MSHCTPWRSTPPALAQPDGLIEATITPCLQTALQAVEPASERALTNPFRPGRPRRLLSVHLSAALLFCLWQGWQTQQAVWRLIVRGFGPFAGLRMSDEGVYRRIEQEGLSCMQALFSRVSQWLAEELTPIQDTHLAPFARGIYAVDESHVDQIKRWLKVLWGLPAGASALQPGRLCGLFDVRRQLWAHIELWPDPFTNVRVPARAMTEQVVAGALLLFDLGYYGYEWCDELTERGVWWISRQRRRATTVSLHLLYCCDGLRDELVRLGSFRADRATSTARLISIRYRGHWYYYLTNVLDPRVLSAKEVAHLYARRWDIELAFRLLKQHLGARVLWSAKWDVLGVQLWSCLILAQILHSWQVRLAWEEEVEPYDVSLQVLLQQVRRARRWGRRCVSWCMSGDVCS